MEERNLPASKTEEKERDEQGSIGGNKGSGGCQDRQVAVVQRTELTKEETPKMQETRRIRGSAFEKNNAGEIQSNVKVWWGVMVRGENSKGEAQNPLTKQIRSHRDGLCSGRGFREENFYWPRL